MLPEPGPHVQSPSWRPLRATRARALPVPFEAPRRLRGPGAFLFRVKPSGSFYESITIQLGVRRSVNAIRSAFSGFWLSSLDVLNVHIFMTPQP